MKKDNKILKIVYIVVGIVIVVSIVYFAFIRKEEEIPKDSEIEIIGNNTLLDYTLLHEINNEEIDNYMISPLSISIAINMLSDGASGNTKSEIDTLLGNYNIPSYNMINNRISIANALFIKDDYKNNIVSDYINLIKNNYNSDILFDKFNSPKVINDWVNEKTFEMIPSILNEMPEEFVLGLANAIAMDMEWNVKFECNDTTKEEFTLNDNSKLYTPMMKTNTGVSYIQSDKAKGIVKDYAVYNKDGERLYNDYDEDEVTKLEFIAILPNEEIKQYVNSFDNEEFNSLLNNRKEINDKTDINVSIPRFEYKYEVNDFKKVLKNLGMKEAFDYNKADFSNMVNDISLYISTALHKSNIEFNEDGTKAAAVTYFGLEKSSMPLEKEETINIIFNKPFFYIIKEKNTSNIWFTGVVYNPTKWEENTKSCME